MELKTPLPRTTMRIQANHSFSAYFAGVVTQWLSLSQSISGSRFSKQLRRALPISMACALIYFVLASTHTSTRFTYPSSTRTTDFPKKIWQTWKVDPLGFEQRDLTRARTWLSKNPSHRYEVLTDQNDLNYVESHFGPAGLNRPDIVHMYKSVSAKIIKADLLRYLVMYADGGVYTDIDVEALRPIDRWIPERYDAKDVDMVIGIEIDQPEFRDHPILGKKSQSFCQWTFMCKPRLPLILNLIENIMRWLNEVAAAQGVAISDIELDFDDVIVGTGPSAFTAAILAEMAKKSHFPVSWDLFHDMAESKVVGGVLVLTIDAFAAGQGHSNAGNHGGRTALVRHHYHASGWPTRHARKKHPVFGEVERCNWNAACIRKWDEYTTAFDALNAEEQAERISVKQDGEEKHEAVANPPSV